MEPLQAALFWLQRNRDGYGAHLPVPVIEWVTPIPDDCSSDWLWIEG